MALRFPNNRPPSVSNPINASPPGFGSNPASPAGTAQPRPPTGTLPSPGKLLGAISSLSSGFAALSGALGGNYRGLLDPKLELFLRTVDQAKALGETAIGEFNNLVIDLKTVDQLRSTGFDRATSSDGDFGSGNGTKQPNALRNFNHYNYIITLGILSQEEFNNPLSYRSNDFQKIILQSGGGNLSKRHQVYAEGSEHAEYYIENLTIDTIVAPNPNTGISLGTTIEFEVTEPYSMGKFTEALVGAAAELGFANFTTAPFCLKIDFQGWDDNGASIPSGIAPYYIPIMFVNVEFSVTNAGSRYRARAIAASDVASSNTYNQVKTEVSVSGATVEQILENSATSVTNTLNDRSEFLENPPKKDTPYIPGYDKYIIAFPTSVDGILQAIQNGLQLPDQLTVPEELGVRLGRFDSEGNVIPVDPDNPAGATRVVEGRRANPQSSIYNTIKAYAITQVNEIGKSPINEDTAEGSNQDMSDPDELYDDAILRGMRRNLNESETADKARRMTFRQSTPITEIIENVILNSTYAQNNTTDEGKNDNIGTRKWFRIDTYTFIDNNPETEAVIGRKPRVYVYAVFPYEMDQAIHLAPNSAPPGTENLRNAAIKEYNYIYTGKNEDVLNFNIDFNYAFLQAAFSDYANFSGADDISSNATADVPNPQNEIGYGEGQVDPALARAAGITEAPKTSETTVIYEDRPGVPSPDGGTYNTNVKKRTAELFHHRLVNSHVDMLMAEMTIWGDPYFLPSINGNYVPKEKSRMLNVEDRMQYLQNEIMVIVNFLTPIDYRTGGALMEFAELEERFSGLYRVITVRNTFNNGQYTQNLKLIRRTGQNDDAKGGSILRTSTSADKYAPYSPTARNPGGLSSQPVAGVPLRLPEFSNINSIGDLGNALGQVASTINQVQGIIQSPQQIFESFSRIMPPEVLAFQGQVGQIKNQLSSFTSQINNAAKSLSSGISNVAGAFPKQTPSSLSPTSTQRPQPRPINTPSTPPVRRPPTGPR